MMTTYHVEWSIDIDAETPEQAARIAQSMMLDPESTATCFDVREFDSDGEAVSVDLMEGEPHA
jgi:hypothetical protein